MPLRDGHARGGHAGRLPFFMYEDAALDHSALTECVPGWDQHDQAAEVAMVRQLQTHPARVFDPARAELFIVPVLPYVSWLAAECAGTAHETRMVAAAAALSRSSWYQRHQGADHLLVTNTFRLNTMKALRGLLANATVAWFESTTAPRRGPGRLAAAAFWRCTVVIPYVASPFCHQQRLTRPTRACAASSASGRTSSVFFQGSLSAASHIRGQLASLRSLPGARIVDVPRSGTNASGRTETCESATCASKLEFAVSRRAAALASSASDPD